MTDNQIDELTTHMAVLEFLVNRLWVFECQKSDDPIGAAEARIKELSDALATAPDGDLPASAAADLRNAITLFFDQVLATLREAHGNLDA